MKLEDKAKAVLNELLAARSSEARLELLMARARAAAPLSDALRVPAHEIEGCQARLWFVAEYRDGCCWFKTDSDSLVAKAIALLLCEFYSGVTPLEILGRDPSFLRDAGITNHLSANRRHALSKVWDRIRKFAEQSVH